MSETAYTLMDIYRDVEENPNRRQPHHPLPDTGPEPVCDTASHPDARSDPENRPAPDGTVAPAASPASSADAVSGPSRMAYPDILDRVRTVISETHCEELTEALRSRDGETSLRLLIERTLSALPETAAVADSRLRDRIFEDMAGLGVLTGYLRDPHVEEININRYNLVEIVYSDRTEFLTDAFPTPAAAVDTVKKMARMGGRLLDAVTPRVDSFIGGGTRITAQIPPLISEEDGVCASIRKQIRSDISREQLLADGAATAPMLDFLTLCLEHGISIGIAGSTGSGKTTDQSFLLNSYIRNNRDWNNRIVTIEDTRELNLLPYDDLHKRPARTVCMATREGAYPVTMRDLIRDALRYHPQIICPVEVRGAEALEAATAGHTGHTILTSLHAPSARLAYRRLVIMMQQGDTALSEETLLEMAVTAWPIMCCKKQLRDGTRKYMEIFEATGIRDGRADGRTLFRFQVTGETRLADGTVSDVRGNFCAVNRPSDRLIRTLCENGAEARRIVDCFRTFYDVAARRWLPV